MKKGLLVLSLGLLLFSCGQSTQWSDAEQQKVRDVIAQQRQRFSLQHMEDDDFSNVQNCALKTVSEIFPEYPMYDSLPDRDATLDGIIADCLVDLAGSDYERLNKLFPYARLVEAGLVSDQVGEGNFYDCLADKLRGAYFNSDVFVMSLLVDPAAAGTLRETIRQCGSGE